MVDNLLMYTITGSLALLAITSLCLLLHLIISDRPKTTDSPSSPSFFAKKQTSRKKLIANDDERAWKHEQEQNGRPIV